ncbi:MAG: hypothetical protein KDA29_09065 [Phycisphaerales bacterium]|nr:hypothetical protein [Phycisphaerales bacterium]
MAGYSGTPLPKKLGIKPASRVLLLNAPDAFTLTDLPEGVTIARDLRSQQEAEVIVLFCSNARDMTARFAKCVQRLSTAGGLWVAWPKKASGVPTDLHDLLVRSYGLDQGLVDNKVCAIDEVWSALRFVRRKNER